MTSNTTQHGSCSCGASTFSVNGKPLVRGFCHCTFCQEFTGEAFSETITFATKNVAVPDSSPIEFINMSKAVQRGKCSKCGDPSVEFLKMPGMPKIAIIPTSAFKDQSFLPQPAVHIFYNRRVKDATDDLPKYNGYLRSQLGYSWRLIGAMLKK